MKPQTVIVIGAGIGGITAAAHLAQHGLRVTVIEKNGRPGGRCDQFSREGHTFDTGPTLMVMPHLFESEFAALGGRMQDLLRLQRVDPTYQLVFDDGSHLALTSDMKCLQEQLEAIEPGSFQGLLRYLDEGHRHYHLGIKKLVGRDFRSAGEFFTPAHLPLLWQLRPLDNHYRHMAAFFQHPRLKAAFTFQDVYMGLSPFEAPATFSLMPYSELAHGVWYPAGGMYQVVEAMMKIARQAGVEFVFNTAVEQILTEGERVMGVMLADGNRLPADTVLANADLPYVYDKLLPDRAEAQALADKRYSCSVISFFWGVDRPYPQLGPHTLFLADDYRENFEQIIDQLDLPGNPSLYLHAPARLDANMAPAGQDTLIAVVPVGHMGPDGCQDWAAIRDKARRQVFRRLSLLGINDLEAHIKFETNFTPLSWRKRYNLVKGSTHGLCHNLTQLGYLRPANRHARYRNLYFAGASTHPGTGLPTAMVSGRLTAQRLLDEQ